MTGTLSPLPARYSSRFSAGTRVQSLSRLMTGFQKWLHDVRWCGLVRIRAGEHTLAACGSNAYQPYRSNLSSQVSK